MKRIISLVLVMLMLVSVVSVTASADDNGKIADNLASVLESIDDNYKLEIFVTLYDTVDEDLVVKMTYEQCGLTKETANTSEEVNLYLSTYRKVKASFYKAYNNSAFEKMNIAAEDVVFLSGMTPYFILKATKSKIYELTQLEEVAFINLHKTPIFPQPDHLYEKRFIEIYSDVIFTESHNYDELYYHYDENGEVDWAFIYQCSYNAPPWNYHTLFKDRLFMYGSNTPFSFGYGIYDVKKDKFYDIISNSFDFSQYEDLDEVFESLNLGYPIGDADFSGTLTIKDATRIQRYVAKLDNLNDEIYAYHGAISPEELGYPKYLSDFNRDGERSILDATAIQRKLAKLD